MCKKIKKHFKRSLPLFLIFSLIISSTVVGVVFNLDFNRVDDKVKVSFHATQVEAQNDSASTTVEVRNAPPEIVSGQEPYEVPTSTSTSPINVGEAISFKTTATDAESNDYYLIVCTMEGVTAHGDGPPTCDNGVAQTLCVSGATTAGDEATCVDSSLNSTYVLEELSWYAYVCDDHSTQADCSTVSQGNGTDEDASPMYVNHAPTLDAVLTTDDFKAPGGTFEFTATSTDTDVAGSADEIILHICRTNDYSTSTGCGGEQLCTASSVAVGDEAVVSCTWDDTSPTPDQAYTYYAFIKDWHDLAATTGQGTDSTYTIINVAPQVSNVSLNGGSDITLNLRGAPETEVVITADLTDENEADDIVSATSSAYLSSIAGTLNCVADDNNCYQIESGDCTIFNRSGASANLQCTTTLAYYAVPTTDGSTANPYSVDNWLAGATVYDEALSHQTVAGTGVQVNQTIGLAVEETFIPYNTIKGGEDSGDYNATTTVVNYGNSPLNTDVNGTDMIHDTQAGETITVDQQKYSLTAQNYSTLDWTLAAAANTRDTEIARATSTDDFKDEMYWGINIPAGTISGDYEGTNTFSAAIDSTTVADWN